MQYIVTILLEYDLNFPLLCKTHCTNLNFWILLIRSTAPYAPILGVYKKMDLVLDEVRNTQIHTLRQHFEGKAYKKQVQQVIRTSRKFGYGGGDIRKALHNHYQMLVYVK